MAEIEQFCLLAKSQKGLACAALVQQVLSHKKIFHFGELLEIQSVQALSESEFSKSFNCLRLFAFGTLSDYYENADLYIELTAQQLTKLKMLTLLTLASRVQELKYSVLKEQLRIESSRELENLIIDAIYAELISGKMDSARQVLLVSSAVGRDTQPAELPDIIQSLTTWNHHCRLLRNELQDSLRSISDSERKNKQEQQSLQNAIKQAKLDIHVTAV